MGELEGRAVVVTGAGRGIGAAVAEGLAAEGAGVLVNDLGVELDGSETGAGPAQEVVDRIVAAGGVAIADPTDVTDFSGTEKMIQRAVDEFGRLDVLINVAGILRDGMIFKMSEEQWDAVIDVHLKGTFNTTRHASAYWREHRGGQFRLINFTSASGLYGAPSQPNYAAAKMGIVGFTLSCANALKQYGVTSNAVSPIATTRMTMNIQAGRAIGQYTPENEKLSARNVVPAVAYLASERSGWLNRRVISAGNGRIGLMNELDLQREIVASSGVWDVASTFDEIENSFRAAIEYPNIFDRPRG
ncbi:MAG: SDR family NAD(P)-dependent oxidoreductase [Gemmatimonadota bacterium]|jgi:NAD(P)-dependent dehydrogenase (short-subunit alcohol dehydrogenase family)